MFRPCADIRVSWSVALVAIALLELLSACGSSPSKESEKIEKTTVETSKGTKKSDQNKTATVPDAVTPAAPPPIPPEATQQFEKALTLLGAGDYGPAAKEFQRLADAYPDYSGPLVNLGIVYLKTGKLMEAEQTLKSATQRGEPSAAAFNQLGIVYRKLGRFKEADESYTKAVTIDPGYPLAHLNLGVLCDMYLQQPQRALAEFERYLQLVPNPDARVAAWVKELQSRVGKPAAPATEAPKS